MPPKPLDRDALHRYLWKKAGRGGMIEIHQSELAEQLSVTRGTAYRTLKKMVEEGRMRKARALEANVGIYAVIAPEVWAERQVEGQKPVPAPEPAASGPSRRGKPVWG